MSLKKALVLLAALTALALAAGCGSSTSVPTGIDLTPPALPVGPEDPAVRVPVRAIPAPGDVAP